MAVATVEEGIQTAMEAITALRSEVKSYGAESGQVKEMQEKTEKAFEANEKKHQEAVTKLAETEKKSVELSERIISLEKEMVTKSAATGQSYKDSIEFKALNNFAKFGLEKMDVEEKKTLNASNNVNGGYLTSTEMDTELVKVIQEISPIRSLSSVRTVSSRTIDIAKNTGIPTALYEGEQAQSPLSDSTYSSEQLTNSRQTFTTGITQDLIMDSNFDIIAEANKDAMTAFAKGEGLNNVLGNGVKKPEGFLANANIIAGARTSETALTITAKDLLLLGGDIKTGQDPIYGFNRQTLAHLRTLTGSNGQFLWQVGLGPQVPNTIGGDPYVVIQDMPAFGVANNLSVIYADFKRGYRITDLKGMAIIRDDITQARNAIILLTFYRWNTGQVILDEAFVALKTKA